VTICLPDGFHERGRPEVLPDCERRGTVGLEPTPATSLTSCEVSAEALKGGHLIAAEVADLQGLDRPVWLLADEHGVHHLDDPLPLRHAGRKYLASEPISRKSNHMVSDGPCNRGASFYWCFIWAGEEVPSMVYASQWSACGYDSRSRAVHV
jgi:hypothetical protein